MKGQENPYKRMESFVTGVLGVRPQECRVYTSEQIAEAQQSIDIVLGTLTFREEEVIRFRYGFDGFVYTLDEMSRIFKVTKERARQIEASARKKLENPIRKGMLEGLLGYNSPKN